MKKYVYLLSLFLYSHSIFSEIENSSVFKSKLPIYTDNLRDYLANNALIFHAIGLDGKIVPIHEECFLDEKIKKEHKEKALEKYESRRRSIEYPGASGVIKLLMDGNCDNCEINGKILAQALAVRAKFMSQPFKADISGSIVTDDLSFLRYCQDTKLTDVVLVDMNLDRQYLPQDFTQTTFINVSADQAAFTQYKVSDKNGCNGYQVDEQDLAK
ncbi:MAG: hypothetical protein ACXWL2_04800 [Candidatus Chromulinivorax sp.]